MNRRRIALASCSLLFACSSTSSSGSPASGDGGATDASSPPSVTDASMMAMGGGDDDAGASPIDASVSPDAAAVDSGPPGCRSANAVGPAAAQAQWCNVDAVLDQAIDATADEPTGGALPGYIFQVYSLAADATRVLEYSRTAGMIEDATGAMVAPTTTTRMAIASATKLISTLAMLRAVSMNALTLQTPASILKCGGLDAQSRNLTLEQMLHQISGLSQTDDACITTRWDATNPPSPSELHSCACTILQSDDVNPPNTFAYTANNFTVAGAMVEAALAASTLRDPGGQTYTWYSWFTQMLTAVGIDPAVTFYNRGPSGNLDSDLAGGLLTTVPDYALLLGSMNEQPGLEGRVGKTVLFDAASHDAAVTPYGDDVTVVYSPFLKFTGSSADAGAGIPFRYGLGNWVQCTNDWPVQTTWPHGNYDFLSVDYVGCAKRIDQSLGKHGVYPWIVTTPSKKTYVAVLGTYDPSSSEGKVDQSSFDVHVMIDPLLSQIFGN